MRRALVSLLLPIVFTPLALADTAVILPFFNLTKDPNLNWVGESISETIHEALASEGLLVLDRAERQEAYQRLGVRPYAQLTRASVMKIGDELDARYVVYGTFQITAAESTAPSVVFNAAKTLKLTARVLDLRRLKQSGELIESASLEDLAAMQTHLSWQALKYLRGNEAIAEKEFLEKRPKIRVDAIENYVRGLLSTNAVQRHKLFTQAARLDPNYSDPCYQLGWLQWEKENYREAADWFKRVADGDAHYAESRFWLGLCYFYLADYKNAAEAFELVATRVPLNEVFCNLGAAQSRLNIPGSLANFQKALEGDAADPDYHFNAGYALWKQGDFDAAADRFRATLDRAPGDRDATTLLGRCLKKQGPRPGELKGEGLERIKETYEESAYRQLKSMLEKAQ